MGQSKHYVNRALRVALTTESLHYMMWSFPSDVSLAHSVSSHKVDYYSKLHTEIKPVIMS